MPVRTKTTRRVAIAAGILVGGLVIVTIAWFGYWHAVDTNPSGGHNSYGMRDYTPGEQKRAAESLVAGLNSHDPANVKLVRFDDYPDKDAADKAIDANIAAALPPPDCSYVLVGVDDEGEHDPDGARWYQPQHAWGFDMNLEQQCPGTPSTPRTIRVIAIPSGMGGLWAEAALYPQP